MPLFVFFFSLIFITSISANTEIIAKIHDIDYGSDPKDEILIFLNSGDVTKISKEKLLNVSSNLKSELRDNWYSFELDDHRYIQEMTPVNPPETDHLVVPPPYLTHLKSSYVPTTVASLQVAQKYHQEGRRNPKESQCFNRAMIWSYEWWKNHSLKSMKILIFFSRNYIRKYNFDWWFHIAPYIHVMDDGKVIERVMDLKYTGRPHSFRDWTKIFMRNDAECPVISKYSDYADYPYNGDCFIYRTHMYTYQPADLQMYEAWGYSKNEFNASEVKAAYLEAFDINY